MVYAHINKKQMENLNKYGEVSLKVRDGETFTHRITIIIE